jgi:hypothetical protein
MLSRIGADAKPEPDTRRVSDAEPSWRGVCMRKLSQKRESDVIVLIDSDSKTEPAPCVLGTCIVWHVFVIIGHSVPVGILELLWFFWWFGYGYSLIPDFLEAEY